MDIVRSVFEFIRQRFFYDLESSITTISFVLLFYFFNKLAKDKGDKMLKTVEYLIEVVMCFIILVIVS